MVSVGLESGQIQGELIGIVFFILPLLFIDSEKIIPTRVKSAH